MDDLEKEIADSKQKIEFFHAKMQELVSITSHYYYQLSVSITFSIWSLGDRFYTRADVTTGTMRLRRESRVINVRYRVSVIALLL